MTPYPKALPETILIVEDDDTVRKVVHSILQKHGFDLLEASSAEEALQIGRDLAGPIHLLLSDVMMPGLTGPNLATQLKRKRPEMRVILMSGYADGQLLILNYGWLFIQKPFVPTSLLKVVADLLLGESREQSTDQFDTRK